MSEKLRIVVCLILLYPIYLCGQEYSLTIESYGTEEGLLHRAVHSVFEDRDGLIWIATEAGLQRFDGHDFTNWTSEEYPKLPEDIRRIGQDDEGWLWLIDVRSRFVFFDPVSETMLTAKERFGDTSLVSPDRVPFVHWNFSKPVISQDDEQRLYLNRSDGITTYHSREGFVHYPIHDPYNPSLLWVDPESKDIFRFTYNYGKYVYRTRLATGGVVDSMAWRHVIYPVSSHDTPVVTIQPERFPSNMLRHGRRVGLAQGRLMLCQRGKRLDIYEKDQLTVWRSLLAEDHHPSLFTNSHNPYLDSKGNIWTFGEYGISMLSIRRQLFGRIFAYEETADRPFYNSARGISVVENDLAVNFERAGTVFTHLSEPEGSYHIHRQSQFDGVARPLVYTQSGYWLSGIYNRLLAYEHRPGNPSYVLAKFKETVPADVWSIYELRKDKFWIATTAGLQYYDAQADRPPEEPIHINPGAHAHIQGIFPAHDHFLWLCGNGGLFLFDPARKIVLGHYHREGTEDRYLPADKFYYAHRDEDDILWLGTDRGLIRWDRQNGHHQLFSRHTGLTNNVIYAVIEDDYNRLWLSSDFSIMAFDKSTFKVKTYLPEDGLAQHEFNRISYFKAEDGTIYFGGLNGITYFHPKDIRDTTVSSIKLLLTDFKIFDGGAGEVVDRTGEVRQTGRITFRPEDRFFRLKFALPTFEDNDRIVYAWQVEGVDADWNYQKENNLQIGLLPYGTHTLRIKGQGANGGWSPHQLSILIEVIKPFYLRNWFLLLAAGALGAAIFGFFTYRTRLLRREITKATATIQQQTEELRQLEKLKSRFFANVSHELRTPLSLMRGPIQRLLQARTTPEEASKLLGFLDRNSKHLKNLVDEILDLSKLENNRLELKEHPTLLAAYLRDHLSQFYSIGGDESVSVSGKSELDDSLVILLDRGKFDKVINNFISNAIKFSPPRGQVVVSTLEKKDTVLISVTDKGRGIAPADLPRVFDRFYQSKVADAPTEGGTGIGLSMARELAKLMGGRVWAESEWGVGSTFYFEIPKRVVQPSETVEVVQTYVEAKSSAPHSQAQAPGDSSELQPTNAKTTGSDHGQPAHILIVEDNADLRAYYQILLSDYKLTLTEHGRQALDFLANNDAPDLIISDLMMPVMDGLQLLERLKSSDDYRHLPVIMLTAKNNQRVRIKALRYGIDDYINKPFDDEELLVRIENLLANSAERQANFTDAKGPTIAAEAENSATSLVQNGPAPSPAATRMSTADAEWLAELEDYITGNLGSSLLTVAAMAKHCHLSESSLLRQLKRLTGLTPIRYLNEIRLNHARQLLAEGRFPTVAEVAYEVGFKDAAAFSRSFKKRFGSTPSSIDD